MYSSFKKHQLITESWRKFLLEATEEEKQYSGDWVDEEYLNSISAKIFELKKRNQEKTKRLLYLEDYPGEIPDDKLQFLAEGSFRAVFAPKNNNDFIIKFAKNEHGIPMNQSEATKGTPLLPKVFKTAKNYSWIVVERINVIKSNAEFNSFFKEFNRLFKELGYADYAITSILQAYVFDVERKELSEISQLFPMERILKNPNTEFGLAIVNPVLDLLEKEYAADENISIQIRLLKDMREQDEMEDEDFLEDPFDDPLEDFYDLLYDSPGLSDKFDELIREEFYKYLEEEQTPLIREIRRLIKTYKIRPIEIGVENTGYDNQRNFKIIDISIEDHFIK